MNNAITPEQFGENEDVPVGLIDAPVRAIVLTHSVEAGCHATIQVPDTFAKAIMVRAHFLNHGGATNMGLNVSVNFMPITPTNSCAGSVSASISGQSGSITTSNWVAIEVGEAFGPVAVVKVEPDLATTTDGESVVLAMLEVKMAEF